MIILVVVSTCSSNCVYIWEKKYIYQNGFLKFGIFNNSNNLSVYNKCKTNLMPNKCI